jgi:hypothetical protein
MFYPPTTSTEIDIATNLALCNIPDPGVYPTHDPTADAVTYHALEARFKRTSSQHADCICANHIIVQYLLKAIPAHLTAIIFGGDLDFAINLSALEIFTAVNAYFSSPTIVDFQALQVAYTTPFTYIDSTSLDTYLANFRTTITTFALVNAPIAPTHQVQQLITNIQASPDADSFTFALQMYQLSHSALTSYDLTSIILALQAVGPSLTTKHTTSSVSPVYSINTAANHDTKDKKKRVYGGYCWSCGNKNHTSAECNTRKEGHQPTCTWINRKEFPGYCIPPRQNKTKA